MKIEAEQLNHMAEQTDRATRAIRNVEDYLRKTQAAPDVQNEAANARTLVHRVQKALVRCGAEDPLAASLADTRKRMIEAGYDVPEPKTLPLSVTSSKASQALLTALRAAQRAAEEVERERREEAYLSEALADYAESVEFEIYGPVGLRERG